MAPHRYVTEGAELTLQFPYTAGFPLPAFSYACPVKQPEGLPAADRGFTGELLSFSFYLSASILQLCLPREIDASHNGVYFTGELSSLIYHENYLIF